MRYVICALLLLFSGCAFNEHDPVHGAAAGGLALGTVGAGTGALIGAAISNGDIAASALLGAAVAVPIGIAAGAYYVSSQNERELELLNMEIGTNRDAIIANEKEILELRQSITDESFEIHPNEELGEHLFTSPSIGNYYR